RARLSPVDLEVGGGPLRRPPAVPQGAPGLDPAADLIPLPATEHRVAAGGPVHPLLVGALQVEVQHAVQEADIEGVGPPAEARLGRQQMGGGQGQREPQCQELATIKSLYRHWRIGSLFYQPPKLGSWSFLESPATVAGVF